MTSLEKIRLSIKIKQVIGKTISILGGMSDILGIFGEWTEISDENFLGQLTDYNEIALKKAQRNIVELTWYCNRPEPSSNHLDYSLDGYEDMLSRGEKFFSSR